MKALCEHIARRANREDRCTGRFFEERFGCRELLCESSIVVCGIYIDLNQIRAGEADTPETSRHTSAYDRILERQARSNEQLQDLNAVGEEATCPSAANWMCELTLQQGPNVDLPSLHRTRSSRRASEKGLLPIGLDDYLALLDWTGRQVRSDKRCSIPDHLAPILDRLRINRQMWTDLATQFDDFFGRLVGPASDLAARAAEAGRRYYRGQRNCSAAFL